MNIFSTIENAYFKSFSKISLNNKVTFVAMMIYLFYRFCYSSEGKSFRKREASEKLSVAWV